ncbi:hypothetical protein HY030_00280 [Candidatus Gottesmanbacteria bacterium]|nr:hypothetical protein [Candidatus Gottesmanbacteria bacterium]
MTETGDTKVIIEHHIGVGKYKVNVARVSKDKGRITFDNRNSLTEIETNARDIYGNKIVVATNYSMPIQEVLGRKVIAPGEGIALKKSRFHDIVVRNASDPRIRIEPVARFTERLVNGKTLVIRRASIYDNELISLLQKESFGVGSITEELSE